MDMDFGCKNLRLIYIVNCIQFFVSLPPPPSLVSNGYLFALLLFSRSNEITEFQAIVTCKPKLRIHWAGYKNGESSMNVFELQQGYFCCK